MKENQFNALGISLMIAGIFATWIPKVAVAQTPKFHLVGSQTKVLASGPYVSSRFLIADLTKQQYVICFIVERSNSTLSSKGCSARPPISDIGGDWKNSEFQHFIDKNWQSTSTEQQFVVRLDQQTGMLSKCTEIGGGVNGSSAFFCNSVDASKPDLP